MGDTIKGRLSEKERYGVIKSASDFRSVSRGRSGAIGLYDEVYDNQKECKFEQQTNKTIMIEQYNKFCGVVFLRGLFLCKLDPKSQIIIFHKVFTLYIYKLDIKKKKSI